MSCGVGNSLKNNCRGVTSIREGRVLEQIYRKKLKQKNLKSTKREVFLKNFFTKFEDITM